LGGFFAVSFGLEPRGETPRDYIIGLHVHAFLN
jgi:hypothetical protein